MFLVNTLNEKLKRSVSEYQTEHKPQEKIKFPYKRKTTSGLLLLAFKREEDPLKICEMTKKEMERTFSLKKLRRQWSEKLKLDFDEKHKKFNDDAVNAKVKEAKKYVKDLIDQDILEVQPKRWNISSKPDFREKPDLTKTLFEVNHGLKDFKVAHRKVPQVPEGADSRNWRDIDGKSWNNATLLEKIEKKEIWKENLEKAHQNTSNYWKKYENDRETQAEIPVSLRRRNLEAIRTFKPYKTPVQDANERNRLMNEVYDQTQLERRKIRTNVQYRNPGCKRLKEKINALVFKEMYSTYRDKFNELTGKKKSPKNYDGSQTYEVADEDLIDKIVTVNNWKDISWFRPPRTADNFEQNEAARRRELLKPLVKNGREIYKEETKIKNQLEEEYKKKHNWQIEKDEAIEKEMNNNDFRKSRYPVEKEEYDKQLKLTLEASHSKLELDTSNTMQIEGENEIRRETDMPFKASHFLEAYKTIALKEIEKKKNHLKKYDNWISYQYSHPGTYTVFEFTEKEPKVAGESEFIHKKETLMAWSCCMNSLREARGCTKTAVNKFKWNLESA